MPHLVDDASFVRRTARKAWSLPLCPRCDQPMVADVSVITHAVFKCTPCGVRGCYATTRRRS